MSGILRRITGFAAFLFALGTAFAASAQSNPPAYYFTLSDLQNFFVTQQQYFVFDNEGTGDTTINHLHIYSLDTSTGDFTGAIYAPLVPPYVLPEVAVPVTGTITINSDVGGYGFSFGVGDFYQIAFNWTYNPNECYAEAASYAGAMSFQGYEGSGKMHAIIAGTVTASYGACLVGGATFGPIPFSGQLVK